MYSTENWEVKDCLLLDLGNVGHSCCNNTKSSFGNKSGISSCKRLKLNFSLVFFSFVWEITLGLFK